MARYSDTVRDQNEAGVAGALVAVREQDGGTPILYDDDDNVLANPLTTDEYGAYYFNTTAGYYDLKFYYGGRLVTENFGVPVGITPTPDSGGLRNTVYPEDMDSWNPDDATEAMKDAIGSGADVLFTPGQRYIFNEDIEFSENDQRLLGSGVLVPVGDCGLVVPEGIVGAKIMDVTFEAPDHTGWAIKVQSGHRTFINDINCIDVFSFLYIEGANTTLVDDFWATVRGKGIVWYGNDTLRSDILIIGNGTIGFSNPLSTEYGLDWDGNCHSLSVHTLGFVGGAGIIIRNTDGVSTFPAIGRFVNPQVDYSTANGIRIEAGLDYDIVAPYVLGSELSGIYVSADINDYEVRITAGKSVGSTTGYGIENDGGVILFGGNTALYDNDQGETSGNVWTMPKDVRWDGTFFAKLDSGNPVIGWDTNDYDTYDRTNNARVSYVGGSARAELWPTYTRNNPRHGVNFAPLAGTSFAVTNPSGNCAGTISNAGAGSGAISGTGNTDFWKMFRVGGNYVKAGGESKKVISIPTTDTLVTEAFTGALTNATFESIPHNPLNPHWHISEAGRLVGPESLEDDTTQCAVFVFNANEIINNDTTPVVGGVFKMSNRPLVTGSGSMTRYLFATGIEVARSVTGSVAGGGLSIICGVGPSNAGDWTAPPVPYVQFASVSLSQHGVGGQNAFTFAKMSNLIYSIDHNSGNYPMLWDMKSVVQQVGAGGTIDKYIYSAVYFRTGGGVAPTNNTGYAASTTLDDAPASGNYFLWNNTTYQSYLGGALEVVGATTFGAPAKLKAYTVATLPTGAAGDTAYVTDATAPVWGTAVVGGGAVGTPVYKDATTWIAG